MFDWFDNTVAIDVEMNGSVLEEKSSFKMLGLTFSSKLDWSSYIISIAKTASKKIGALICSMMFLSPERFISDKIKAKVLNIGKAKFLRVA